MEVICGNPSFLPEKRSSTVTELTNTKNEAKQSIIRAIFEDNKAELVTYANRLFKTGSDPLDRRVVSKLLHLCCASDSADSAAALLNGELGTLPLVNEFDDETGRSPLHTAAESHSKRCVELLLKKRGRTDLKTKDGRSLIPLELSFFSRRLELIWNPDDFSVEELLVLLSEKDLTAVKLLSEKTKEAAEVAYANAVNGRIVPLAALLVVAASKINEAVVEVSCNNSKEKATVYEGVVRKALSLGPETASLGGDEVVEGDGDVAAERRKLLLREIELLQLFGAVACSSSGSCTDKRVTSLLLRAAGDVAVIELLLKTNIDVFLLEDPDAINYRTEMKETPLFFAVKNDQMKCAEALLRWGASNEVLNLRRQRPIDLAKSQDMRYKLSPTNISHLNRTSPDQPNYTTYFQGDEIISGTCDALLILTEENTTESCSSTKTEICKYFASPRGCVRGDKCFYAHSEKELRQKKQGTHPTHSPTTTKDLRRKIFVGGLPPTLDSELLRKFFEEQFGAVEDAMVLGMQVGNELRSRGFGFVTFKEEKTVSTAVETHFVSIMGKQVEMKSVLPKCLLLIENQKLSPGQHDKEQNHNNQPRPETPNEKIIEEAKPEQMSWADRLLHGQPKTCSNELQVQGHISPSRVDQSMPAWFKNFKKWLPFHLKEQSKLREGEYALSSLKGDFRAKFGLELDHASLGYPKLSDFMRSFPDICHMKVGPIGKCGTATHLVLQPNLPKPHDKMKHTLTMPNTSSNATSINESVDSEKFKCCQDLLSGSCEKAIFADSNIKENLAHEYPEVNSDQNNKMPGVPMRLISFLKPDHLFHGRPWLRNGSNIVGDIYGERGGYVEGIKQNNFRHQQRHLVLDALLRKRNNTSVFFLRDPGFYTDYIKSLNREMCFACNQRKMLWANFPCQHLLWCSDCRLQAIQVAGASDQRCVLCDLKVEKIGMLPWHDVCQAVRVDLPNVKEFPPFDPNHIRSPSKKKSPWISN
ncbi:heterogeneous nuclear ribonucleoprotein 1 [Quercus suber]|uniref:Heterogeneous nuclear ribonucleoprotein 1 n=2 Tax=Quercus suber TaxID=58331 RepID=A0AAW0LK43_QUESU